jgi:predicted nucleic acid-binding protein
MTLLLDTNILVAAVMRDRTSEESVEHLDNADDIDVSVASLVGFGNVSTRGKQFDRLGMDRVENQLTSRFTSDVSTGIGDGPGTSAPEFSVGE